MKTRYVIGSIDQPVWVEVLNRFAKKPINYRIHSDEAYATRFECGREGLTTLGDLCEAFPVLRSLNLIVVPIRQGLAEEQVELPL